MKKNAHPGNTRLNWCTPHAPLACFPGRRATMNESLSRHEQARTRGRPAENLRDEGTAAPANGRQVLAELGLNRGKRMVVKRLAFAGKTEHQVKSPKRLLPRWENAPQGVPIHPARHCRRVLPDATRLPRYASCRVERPLARAYTGAPASPCRSSSIVAGSRMRR